MTTSSPLALAIVADNLTGALDAAGAFAARGLPTRLIVAADGATGWDATPCSVLSVTTESRHLGRDEAAERVRATVADLRHHHPRLLFKQLDATLRGNVAIEIAAALEASGRRHAVIAPALPEAGRVMCGGDVYVDGIPLRDTTIGLDTPAPPPRVPLGEALWQSDPGLTVHDVGLDEEIALDPAGAMHAYVVDCVTADDLDRIVLATLPHEDDVVLAGAFGLAEALARQMGSVPPPSGFVRTNPGLTVVVAGSRSVQSTAQVEAARSEPGVLVLPAPGGKLDVDRALAALRAGAGVVDTLVVHAQPPVSGMHADYVATARTLAARALALLARVEVGALAIVGGDTTNAMLEALGARAIDVLGQVLPGVTLGAIARGDGALPIVAKEGDFGNERFLADVARALGGDRSLRS